MKNRFIQFPLKITFQGQKNPQRIHQGLYQGEKFCGMRRIPHGLKTPFFTNRKFIFPKSFSLIDLNIQGN